MKFFLVTITYIAENKTIEKLRPEHRNFLDTGYSSGKLLLSGPMIFSNGGVVIARDISLEAIHDFISSDPYLKANAAEYTFKEFNPVKFNPIIEKWINNIGQ